MNIIFCFITKVNTVASTIVLKDILISYVPSAQKQFYSAFVKTITYDNFSQLVISEYEKVRNNQNESPKKT